MSVPVLVALLIGGYMTQEVKLQLRLPADIHKWVTELAKTNSRSLNGQLVHIIREDKQRYLNEKEVAQ